ncbi:tol-pal system-associated acyl-CoA thioesterase [Oceanibaculum indicum]|uniref:Acyl-CoA thioester hydrolase n=1 Tax=Oceanibaculum indicum TaxID=526216 RepID=A0A420WB30_9PROT|nr:tol-pal system-associated acyl-CoA thioesterase [Oceanibaculum indicum]RKQ68166.1 acyl-CoA thioester hydrolase [Oceanibaculum indicum]
MSDPVPSAAAFVEGPDGRRHRLPVRIYYEDTDAGGIVYHANYLRYAERARSEMLRDMGFGQAALRDQHGIAFAVRGCTIDYVAPARLDDLLWVETRVLSVGGATIEAEQRVERDGALLVRMHIRLACLGAGLRPARLPTVLRDAMQALLHPTSAIFVMTLLAS